MPDVVMISNYWHFPWEKASSRYHTAAAELAGAGMTVEVVTSSFYHTRKRQHEPVSEPLPYRATLLHERGYAKNVSPMRAFSHRAFARRVVDYLKKRERPDAIYLFVPPTGLAKRVVQFAKRNGIPVVIDVLDLWPEAFDMVLPHAVAQVVLRPMKRAVEYAYANADAIVAVSQTYVQRALRCNDRCAGGRCVFIGTELAGFDRAAAGAPELTGRLRPVTMAYIGMLGHSYDRECPKIKYHVAARAGLRRNGAARDGRRPPAREIRALRRRKRPARALHRAPALYGNGEKARALRHRAECFGR